jgi:hypothetical protein
MVACTKVVLPSYVAQLLHYCLVWHTYTNPVAQSLSNLHPSHERFTLAQLSRLSKLVYI